MHNVITIIMAGGQGNRLYPLTKIRSKPAVPIAGRFRLIDFPISNSIHSGFKKIFILTQFSSESLHRHIFLTYRFDNFTRDFVTILSAQQTLENRDWYQGTADAVRQSLGFLRSEVGSCPETTSIGWITSASSTSISRKRRTSASRCTRFDPIRPPSSA